MDKLAAMHTFVAVVEHGGFSAAARSLAVSTTLVSRRVAELEKSIGVQLLQRSTRRVELTESGQAYLERCKRLLADLHDTEAALGQLQDNPSGLLRVNAPLSFGFRHIAPAIAAFQRRYPQVEVDLSMTDRFVDVVDEGFDVVIRASRSSTDESLISRRLADLEMRTAASPDYLTLRGTPQLPEQLVDHDCLLYNGRRQWHYIDPQGQQSTTTVSGRFNCDNGDAILALARAGLGIAQVPTFMWPADGSLRALLPDHRCLSGSIRALYPPNRHLSTRVRLFVEFLSDYFRIHSIGNGH